MDIIGKLKGKKTYIMMIATGVLGIGQSLGWVLPDWIWWIDVTLLGGSIRAGMAKMEVK